MRLIFDIETDGLLEEFTKAHCVVTQDAETGEVKVFRREFDTPGDGQKDGTIADGLAYLEQAELLAGHNVVGFDLVALKKLYPSFNPRGKVLDTLVGVNAVWPVEHLSHLDYQRLARPDSKFPKQMVGRHSLEAWGYRLLNRKGEKPGDFKVFTSEMLTYCIQDVNLTRDLFLRLERRIRDGKFSLLAWEMEQAFAVEIAQQEKNGFLLDVRMAEALTQKLQARRAELKEEIAKTFAPFEIHYLTEKKKLPKTKIVQFNPGSRDHIAKHLVERCQWRPTEGDDGHTPCGKVKIDENVLHELQARAGIPLLIEYLTVNKVLGMLSDGKQAWIKKAEKDGRIHGRVRHNGAVTCRCTHSSPNMTQVPKVGNPWGAECRELFIAGPGRVLLGGDASGLELRALAHFLFPYDGGVYVKTVTEGDPHRQTQLDAGIPDGPTARDTAKRFKYAWLYGAGDKKLGKVLGCSPLKAKAVRMRMLRTDHALAQFKKKVTKLAMSRGTLKMPDGRYVFTRSSHAALNTALQGAGAIVMKLAVVLMHRGFRARGLDVRQVHMAHDEVQLEVLPEQAEEVKQILLDSIRLAGVELGIRCPLTGEAKIGRNWKETH